MNYKKILSSAVLTAAITLGIYTVMTGTSNAQTKIESIKISLGGASKPILKNSILTINFDKEYNGSPAFINYSGINVFDSKNKKVKIYHKLNSKGINIYPPKEGYKQGKYRIAIESLFTEDYKAKNNIYYTFNVANSVNSKPTKISNTTKTTDSKETVTTIIADPKLREALKDYQGGKSFNKVCYTRAERSKPLYKENEYRSIINNFFNKYEGKKEYDYIIDPQYYMHMPGITLDYSNANTLGYKDKSTSKFDSDFYIDNGSNPIQTERNNKSFSPWFLKDDTCVTTYIWRPDVESDTLREINYLRKKEGLNELKLNNDLSSLAKFSASRDFLDNNCARSLNTTVEDYIVDEMIVRYGLKNYSKYYIGGTATSYRVPVQDITPYAFKLEDSSKLLDYSLNNKNKFITTERMLKEVFNYNTDKKVYSFQYNSMMSTNAQQILNIIANNDIETAFFDGKGSAKYKSTYYIKDIIYKKDINEIGIGSLYSIPHNKDEGNGLLKLSVLVK